ncbi:nitrate- and nitrite sensing domain-containing protein [Streptomyces sp. NPDC008092]|uniref:sensor histidine kinase n=1 Tax=Streptomyces sp. NPDC008092 TaxID=3364808 RepID=UPI0036ED9879
MPASADLLSGPAGSGGSSGRLPLRTVLIILVVVPSLALAPLWGLSTYQLATRWQSEKAQSDLSASLGRPSSVLFQSLDEERRLTAELQADPGAKARGRLAAARAATDKAVTGFRPVAGESTSHGQQGLGAALSAAVRDLDRLAAQRRAVDAGSAGQKASFDYYSGTIDSLITVFTALGRRSNAEAALLANTLVDLYGAIDRIGREDALLGRDWQTGHLQVDEYDVFVDAVGAQEYLLQRVALGLTGAERDAYEKTTSAKSWKTQQSLEEQVIVAGPHHSQGELVLGQIHTQWRASVDANRPRLMNLVLVRVAHLDKVSADSVGRLQWILISISAVGLLAVVLVILTSWRLTVLLRRRIYALREEAVGLQQRLPDVVSRLERGENVDVDREVRLVESTPDELGELGRALNAASRSAVATAVRQAEQHRGFERLLQRIARRTQILIGLQLRKLDELERRHEDPEVLEGLFDLDHLTARLRRYEENLVILGGGQPQRRWRKPVRLLDVLRAAQGEVQDYRRISIDVEDEPWVSERAVGTLVHILAELMENAAAFSKPPTPVEVRAARVGRGVAVEIEDRGLGMEPEHYAAANALMEAPPQLDVMTQADDVRLGLYVVARLSAGLGLRVELRPSAFGGTRVVVLLPEQVVVEEPRTASQPGALPPEVLPEALPQPVGPRPHPHDAGTGPRAPYEGGRLPTRARGHAMANVTASGLQPPDVNETEVEAQIEAQIEAEIVNEVEAALSPSPSPSATARPLPQRVRQASLAPELQTPAEPAEPHEPELWTIPDRPGRSGATIGAFQRQSRLARSEGDPDDGTGGGATGYGTGRNHGYGRGHGYDRNHGHGGDDDGDNGGRGDDGGRGDNGGGGDNNGGGNDGSRDNDGSGDGTGFGGGKGEGPALPNRSGSPRTDDRE